MENPPVLRVSVKWVIVETMADSGAEVGLEAEEWYVKHLFPKQVVVHGMDIQITGADGTGIPCLGYVQIDLEVES